MHLFVLSSSAAVKRVTPWILFGGHRPGYIDTAFPHSPQGTGDIDVADQLQKELGPLWLMVSLIAKGCRYGWEVYCKTNSNYCSIM